MASWQRAGTADQGGARDCTDPWPYWAPTLGTPNDCEMDWSQAHSPIGLLQAPGSS